MKKIFLFFLFFIPLIPLIWIAESAHASSSNESFINLANTTNISIPTYNNTNISIPNFHMTTQNNTLQHTNSCPCIIFRLDDVQAFYLSNVQMKIIDQFQKKNASLTIGIIGYDFTNDKKLVSYIQALKQNNLEIANHGWKHENFTALNLSQQVSLINKTNQELIKTFGDKPDLFITPYNVYNNNTLHAVAKNNMKIISSGFYGEPFVTAKPNFVKNKDTFGLYHVPSMTDFQIVIGSESQWIGIPQKAVLASIDSRISKYGYDVVLLHPQNFALFLDGQYIDSPDNDSFSELSSIIDYAKSKNIKIINFSDLVNMTNHRIDR